MIEAGTPPTAASPWQAFRRSVARTFDSFPYTLVASSFVIFSVFAWDVANGWLPKTCDTAVEILMSTVFCFFVLELLMFILAIDKWWKKPSFWIYLIATLMMVFDIPWMGIAQGAIHAGAGSSVANLRLVKLFRVLARIGRLLRVIRSLVVANSREMLARVILRRKAPDRVKPLSAAPYKRKKASGSRTYEALERTTTYAVLGVFCIIYVIAAQFLSSIQRDPMAEDFFAAVTSSGVSEPQPLVTPFLQNHPEILYLKLGASVFVDSRDSAREIRQDELLVIDSPRGSIWVDIRDYTTARARWDAMLTAMLILAITYLLVAFSWIVSHFSLELSGALNTLAQALEERDAYTRMHSKNVSTYAVQVARAMKLSARDQKIVKLAGELHDIGKIGVPESILLKPAKLTDAEYTVMKRHPGQGANILDHLVDFESVITAACHHHEKHNGTGYPDGLAGEEIPLMARILSVCDVWDALTTDRPYREALPFETARRMILEGSGTDFDPRVVAAFMDSIGSAEGQSA